MQVGSLTQLRLLRVAQVNQITLFDVSDDGIPSDGDGDGDSTNDPTITLTDPNPDMEVVKTAFVNDNGDGLLVQGILFAIRLK